MPIEIRELVIRAIVAPPADDRSGPATRGTGAGPAISSDLVQACVDEVLRQLRRAGEP